MPLRCGGCSVAYLRRKTRQVPEVLRKRIEPLLRREPYADEAPFVKKHYEEQILKRFIALSEYYGIQIGDPR